MSENKLTLEEIKIRIQEIKDISYDNEKAHGYEDQLREDILKAISEGAENAQEMAKLALSTNDIKFSRWYA